MKPAIILCLVTFIVSTGNVIASDIEHDVLPAATGDAPEDVELKKLPPPARKENIRRPTRAELDGECRKAPECAKQMRALQGGGKGEKPLPAATGESPEEIEFKKLPQPANVNRPPRSEAAPSPLNTFMSRLNPIGTAHAATGYTPPTTTTSTALYLTPTNNFVKNGLMNAYMYGMGVLDYSYPRKSDYYLLYPYYVSTNTSYAENKPYVMMRLYVGKTARYRINYSASPGPTKLRHQSYGPIIENWDYTGKNCNPCNHQVIRELSAGYHYLYLWGSNNQSRYVYSASVEPY